MSRATPLTPRRVFFAARRVPHSRRDAFVEKVCRENEELRRRVQELLAAAEEPSAFARPPTEAKRLLDRLAGTSGERSQTTPARERGPLLRAGARISDRYVVEALVGEGSSGRVYSARDEGSRTTVAVKVLELDEEQQLARLRCEAATLRWLRVPGVVNLLDDGVDAGRPYIVTDLVVGAPFPGSVVGRTWASIRETAVALLETLARIHAQGVIHGDLKPSNVLVDERGVPTVLDVGIASGPSIDFGDAEDDDVVAGTPSYMAPERIGGAPASVATDLYAVGVMLHQALCGEVPHHETNRSGLFDRRRLEDSPPIRESASETPADAARMIDALLAREPEDRPASAYDALDLLEHLRYVRPGHPDYPWLGTRELIDGLVQAAKDGRSVDVWGPPGSGKTRTLREAAREIEALGRRVAWLAPSTTSYGSLPAECRPVPTASGASTQEIAARAEAALVAALATGLVVVADPLDACDEESRALLATCRPAGAVVRTSADPGRLVSPVRVPCATPADLERIFSGSNLIDHLPEDAAAELCRAADGNLGLALRRAAAWVRGGLATWDRDRVAIDRYALERIAAGLATPSTAGPASGIDGARPDGGVGPFDPSGSVRSAEELLTLVRDARARGRLALASTLVTAGALRRGTSADARARAELLETALELGLADGTPYALDRVVRLASTHVGQDGRADAIRRIALAALHTLHTRSADATSSLDDLPIGLSDALEACAHSVRIMAARAGTLRSEEDAVAAAARWAGGSSAPRAPAMLAGWIGWLRYRQGRFEDAAALHLQAARLTPPLDPARATRLAHAAQAHLEAGNLEAADEAAGEAIELAARARARQVEARAHVMRRIGRYRLGTPDEPAPALVRAIRAVGVHHLSGELDLTEAAAAWRRGDPAAAIDHARHASGSFRRSGCPEAELLAHALLAYLDPNAAVDETLVRSAGATSPPGVAVQSAALLVAAGRVDAAHLADAVRRASAATPPLHRGLRREVLSIDEAIALGELGRRVDDDRSPAQQRRRGGGDATASAGPLGRP